MRLNTIQSHFFSIYTLWLADTESKFEQQCELQQQTNTCKKHISKGQSLFSLNELFRKEKKITPSIWTKMCKYIWIVCTGLNRVISEMDKF